MTTTHMIEMHIDGEVALIRLNRPDRMNALTPDMLDLLAATIREAPAGGARAILLTGEGKAFCSGADLASTVGNDVGNIVRRHYNPAIEAFAASPIPIVTAINGPAAGAGVSLALAGDIILAARSSYLLLAFVNIGLVPDAGATWLVGKAVGRAKLLEMALLGERLSAETALDAGLITRVAEDETLLDDALAITRKLAAMPTMALGLIRKQAGLALSGTLTETLALEADHQQRASESADFKEGVAAFLAKRPPVFSGT
jgi:2-(1,2-epoxy-1,2-dihydrophenyl)acetyl-CoA isomerase